MTPRTWFWSGLLVSSVLCGCSAYDEKQQRKAIAVGATGTQTKENPSHAKTALVAAETSTTAQEAVVAAGGTVTHDLPILNAVGARLRPENIEALSLNSDVTNIVIDAEESDGRQQEGNSSVETLHWLIQEQGSAAQNAWLDALVSKEKHGLTGHGVGIAIIDTGIAETTNHPEWRPNIVARYDAIADREPRTLPDFTGHGTHISSLIAGVDDVLQGVAPNASIVAIKAFDSKDEANFLDLLRALQWVIANKERYGIRVVNLSLSASAELPYHIDPLNRALTKAWEHGLVVVVSAGNQGPAPSTVTAPGNNPWLISVGAASAGITGEAVEVAPFSGRGPTASGHIKPNIVAPGVRLAGILPENAERPIDEPIELTTTGLWITSGASQASAVVAGMVTLLLEARPDLSNNDVKCLIANTATPLGKQNQVNIPPMAQGRGLINLTVALESAATTCPERFEDLPANTPIEGAYLPN